MLGRASVVMHEGSFAPIVKKFLVGLKNLSFREADYKRIKRVVCMAFWLHLS